MGQSASSVFYKRAFGDNTVVGPHNLGLQLFAVLKILTYRPILKQGLPEDRYLSKHEKTIVLEKLISKRAKEEKCMDKARLFFECEQKNPVAFAAKCRAENDELIKCILSWCHDAKFRQEVTDDYLKERSEFRKTGLNQQMKKRIKEQELIDNYLHHLEETKHQTNTGSEKADVHRPSTGAVS